MKDWQNDVDAVLISVPAITGQEFVALGSFDGTLWQVNLVNSLGAPAGNYSAMVKATSTDSGGLALYDFFTIAVTSSSPGLGWARVWGDNDEDEGEAVALDKSGNVYVTGEFEDTVDFDPGPGTDFQTSSGKEDIFLAKYNSKGDFLWARTWGGPDGSDSGMGVVVSAFGEVYVTGHFRDSADFDPDATGQDTRLSNGERDVFLAKYDENGNYLWALTWGSIEHDKGLGIDVDTSGAIYVTGYFREMTDFDPSDGTDLHFAVSDEDFFLSKFDSSGNFQWARTWGGSDEDKGESVSVDDSGNIYVAGRFMFTVDFDPGPGTDLHSSNGLFDISLSKFSSNGDFQWARTWGAAQSDEGFAVTVDGAGNSYVTGYFQDTVDFDTGAGLVEQTSLGMGDVFISVYNTNGEFQWARIFGGSMHDEARGVALDASGNLYITGLFAGSVDFDPGPGVDERTSNGASDIFISKFNSSGDFIWASTIGGDLMDSGSGITVDALGVSYSTGFFKGGVELEPGPGTDQQASKGLEDAFLIKLMPDGNW